MAIGTKSNGNVTYLQVDYGKKSMYIYSSTPKEGYEEHVSEKGATSYRMYVSYVSGLVDTAYFRDGRFGGQEFVLMIRDGDEKYSISFPIDSSAFTQAAKSLNNIDVSKTIRFSIYENKAKNGKSYLNVGISYPEILNDDGKPTFVEWGEDYPPAKQLRSGKWDFTDVEEEAYIRAEKFIKDNGFDEKFESQKENKGDEIEVDDEEQAPEPTSKGKIVDDLPF